jgi:hypothetical protein
MTSDELKSVFNEAIIILQDNKNIVTPEVLTEIESLVQAIKQLNTPLSTDAVIVIEAIIDREKKLINSTDKIVSFLTGIQSRPLIMKLIAAII